MSVLILLMQQQRKYIFWYPCPLYPLRTENSVNRIQDPVSCYICRLLLCFFMWWRRKEGGECFMDHDDDDDDDDDDGRAPLGIFLASDSSSQWRWSLQRRSFCPKKKRKKTAFFNSPSCWKPQRTEDPEDPVPYVWGSAVVHHIPDHVPDPGQVGLSDTLHLGGDRAHHLVELLVLPVPQHHNAAKIKTNSIRCLKGQYVTSMY